MNKEKINKVMTETIKWLGWVIMIIQESIKMLS